MKLQYDVLKANIRIIFIILIQLSKGMFLGMELLLKKMTLQYDLKMLDFRSNTAKSGKQKTDIFLLI